MFANVDLRYKIMKHFNYYYKGFFLIELLVAITILGSAILITNLQLKNIVDSCHTSINEFEQTLKELFSVNSQKQVYLSVK